MHHISKELDFIGVMLFPFFFTALLFLPNITEASATGTSNATSTTQTLKSFTAKPPIHVLSGTSKTPKGLSPDQIKTAYRLPKSGGAGTIAIVTAYESPTIESDLAAFDTQFKITPCTIANKCLEIHPMATKMRRSTGWAVETALDTEWAHAIAPTAKILVIEAVSSSGPDLMKAVDYAQSRSDVVSVSMSWGGKEFKEETDLDSHFTSNHNIAFFSASGDNGTGTSWPAASPNVIAVGGTSISFDKDGTFGSEKAWSGSGGGTSLYETEPGYQRSYSIAKANGKRAIPDVAFNADPRSGYSVYHNSSWIVVGGTSAGAPQWAAIKTLDTKIGMETTTTSFLTRLYEDKASADHAKFFRDIVSGSNGNCGYMCDARKRYDFVTGLGTPIAHAF